MTPDLLKRAADLFDQAIRLDAPARAAFIDLHCPADSAPELRALLTDLLQAHDHQGAFLATPAPDHGMTEPRPSGSAGNASIHANPFDPNLAAAHAPAAANAPDSAASTALPPGVPAARAGERVGKYKLLECIGEGGFGEVWVAEQDKPVRRKVALKIVKAGMDTREVLARFEAERQALAVMDHPNVARVFDAGATDSGRPYFVMEHVPGVPITAYCDSSRMKIRDRLGLLIDVCSAVQHAHQKGIIHRDLKPGNILVTLHDGKPVPKVIDFGIAKAAFGRLTERTLYTETGRVIGTPEYMSPEQAGTTGMDVDTRADIYSLGVLLYQLLTGTLPFDGQTLREAGFDGMAKIIREAEPPKPSTRVQTLATEKVNRTRGATPEALARTHGADVRTLQRDLRGDLDWITMKALEKDRTRRYDTAADLAADLRRHLTGEPVIAAPPSLAYRAAKFMRRYKKPVIAGLSFAAVLMISVVGLSITASWAIRERNRAVLAEHDKDRQRQIAEHQAYAANLFAARAELTAGALEQTRARLAACTPSERNWEWRYLNAEANAAICSIPEALAFSNSSRRIATTNGVWDADAGRELYRWPQYEYPAGAVYSPDDRLIATFNALYRGGIEAHYGSVPSVLDAHTGRKLFELADSAGNEVYSAAFSPSGSRIVTSSADKIARVWDVEQRRELFALVGHAGKVYFATFSRDGKRIATASGDHTARVWDADNGRQLFVLAGHTDAVRDVGFSPDGARILTASSDNTARLWSSADGQSLTTLAEHASSIYSAVFNYDGKRIATASADGTARIWNAVNGEDTISLTARAGSMTDATFAHNDNWLIARSSGCATVWDAASGHELFAISDDSQWNETVGMSPDGKLIHANDLLLSAEGAYQQRKCSWSAEAGADVEVSLAATGARALTRSPDSLVRLWDTSTGLILDVIAPECDVESFAFSPSGTRFVAVVLPWCNSALRTANAARGREVRLFDALDGRMIGVLERMALAECGVGFSDDGSRVATLHRGRSVDVWHAADGSQIATLSQVSSELQQFDLSHVQFGPDGERVIASNDGGIGVVWDVLSAREIARPVRPDSSGDFNGFVAFSSDGKSMVSSTSHDQVFVHNLGLGIAVALDGRLSATKSAKFSADAARLVTTSCSDSNRLWNTADGSELLKDAVCAEPTFASSLELSPNGELAAAVMATTGTVIIYDLNSGAKLETLQVQGTKLGFLCFSKDGSRVATCDQDGTVRVWSPKNGTFPQEWPTVGLSGFATQAAFNNDASKLAVFWGAYGRLLSTGSHHVVTFETPQQSGSAANFSDDGATVMLKRNGRIVAAWNAQTGASLPPESKPTGRTDSIQTTNFSDDLARAIVQTVSGAALLLDGFTGAPITAMWSSIEVSAVADTNCDASILVTATAKDARAQVWDVAQGIELARLIGHCAGVKSVAMSPNGARVVTGSYDKNAIVWDATLGTQLAVLSGHATPVDTVAICPNGLRVLTGSADGALRLWSVEESTAVQRPTAVPQLLRAARSTPTRIACFSNDGSLAMTVSGDSIDTWDVRNGKPGLSFRHDANVTSAALSPDGRFLVSTSEDRTARTWDLRTGQQLQNIGLMSPGRYATFVQTGASVFIGTNEGEFGIFDAATGKQVGPKMASHRDAVVAAAFTADGSRVMTASRDRTVRVWDPIRGEELLSFDDASDAYVRMWLTPDARRIVAVTEKGGVLTWDSAPQYRSANGVSSSASVR